MMAYVVTRRKREQTQIRHVFDEKKGKNGDDGEWEGE